MNKDNKNITTTTNQVVAGNSPLSAGLKASLASFSDARDTAFKNSQAESIVSTENSNTKNDEVKDLISKENKDSSSKTEKENQPTSIEKSILEKIQ